MTTYQPDPEKSEGEAEQVQAEQADQTQSEGDQGDQQEPAPTRPGNYARNTFEETEGQK